MSYFYILDFQHEFEYISPGTYFDIYVQKNINSPILIKEKHDPAISPRIQITFNNTGDYFIILHRFIKFGDEYEYVIPRYIKTVLIGKKDKGTPSDDVDEIIDIPTDDEENGDNASDIINDIILDYIENTLGIQYEVQQLVTDLWINSQDSSFINNMNNLQRFGFYNDFVGSIVLTDNIDLENKISTTEFIRKVIKLIWNQEQISQLSHNSNDIQSLIQIEQTYLYNIGNNTYYVKIGDIIKDPMNDNNYYIVENVQELKYFDIVNPPVGIYSLDLHKLNINIIPNQIKNYYVGG